ncbi:MAG: hypothetical protein HON90_04940 [Halobacteriovoraceae bacterium]|jgi:hypothetical protein|nr:hypothetical protein [Halobacteriovoraceae bacterium]
MKSLLVLIVLASTSFAFAEVKVDQGTEVVLGQVSDFRPMAPGFNNCTGEVSKPNNVIGHKKGKGLGSEANSL